MKSHTCFGHSRVRYQADDGGNTNTVVCRNYSTVKKHEAWCWPYHRSRIWIIMHHNCLLHTSSHRTVLHSNTFLSHNVSYSSVFYYWNREF